MNRDEMIERLQARMAELDVKPQTVSQTATGSKDTIRNWLRKHAKGEHFTVRQDTLESVARALNVSLMWLMTGSDDGTPEAPGFAEETLPFTPKPNEVQAIRTLYGASAKHAQTARRAQIDMPGLGILAGDVIVVDLGREATVAELVMVTIQDETGAAATVIRRYFPPYLMAMATASDQKPMRDDDEGVIVRYPVIGIIRGLQN